MATISEIPRFPTSTLSDAEITEQLTCAVKSSERQICEGCREPLLDRYLLNVSNTYMYWHTGCLRCCVCCAPLQQKETCFVKRGNIYCRKDYISEVTKCTKCSRQIQASDWVRRARDKVFHLACFACDTCERQLSTGEEFALVGDNILCIQHYTSRLQGDTDSEVSSEPKPKRARSSFTEEQLKILHGTFNVESNPDSESLNNIATTAGISRCVAQVWFQNARAKQKKQQRSQLSSSCPRVQMSSGSEGQFSDSTSD